MAGAFFLEGKISLPSINMGSGAASACLVTINQNGAPVYVGQAGAEGFKTDLSCALADVIAIVLTSAAAVDQPINAIKTTIAWGLGE
jgi:hypothetical protein